MQEDPDHIGEKSYYRLSYHNFVTLTVFPLGLIPRAIVHIFEGKEAEEDDDTMFDVRVSYIEIYNEEIRDLLGDDPTKKLEIKVSNYYWLLYWPTIILFNKAI